MNTSHSTNVMTVETRRKQDDQKNVTSFQKKPFCTAKSLVSLTLMDGIDNRGEIVVIGATNRLDSIDPALRRPGRFGRHFLFNLPDKEARKEIVKIHTRDWTPQPPDMLLDELAEKCIGYCGADIKSLCTEAALCSLRRCYPQIYASREKLLLDVNSIKIKAKDFFMAMKKVVPASNRIKASPVQALSPIFKPLFQRSVENILQVVQKIFPHAQLALKEDRQQEHFNPILQDDMFDSDDDASLVSGDELKDGMPDGPEKKCLCFSRQLRKPKLERKKEYNTVTRTLRSRGGAKTVRRVHGENRDLELRRSCRVGHSRYSTTNSSILFDKLMTKCRNSIGMYMEHRERKLYRYLQFFYYLARETSSPNEKWMYFETVVVDRISSF
ncbi:ATPase family AAA domain-containing protein 2-like [Aythya fuligula]|uniref:ATPase family AAA domain-containing protein 2-like n=1 Tax=Aythya fuligula TaxID=219594 RepID=A0A6J3EMF8_AYTFU|nr:ATPase family AAA domain-containing protein 2-like [Aythya fuligula]